MKKKARIKNICTVFPITERGYALALTLKKLGGEVNIYEPAELRRGRLRGLVKEAFLSSTSLVFIGASGIAVRSIAQLLKGKALDPAVIVIDEMGRFVISLVSGHLGGANRLTEEIAELLKATPVITTATDVHGLPCIEDVALRFNLAIENVSAIKALNTAILGGGPVFIMDNNRKRLSAIREFLNKETSGVFAFGTALPKGCKTAAIISSTLKVSAPKGLESPPLILRPREFVAGIGCRRGTSARDIKKSVDNAFKGRGVSPLCIRNLATIDIKGNEVGLLEFAKSRGHGLELFTAEELNERAGKGSEFVLAATGARAVAEPAALISSGAKRLWLKKQKSARVTVAAARVSFTS